MGCGDPGEEGGGRFAITGAPRIIRGPGRGGGQSLRGSVRTAMLGEETNGCMHGCESIWHPRAKIDVRDGKPSLGMEGGAAQREPRGPGEPYNCTFDTDCDKDCLNWNRSLGETRRPPLPPPYIIKIRPSLSNPQGRLAIPASLRPPAPGRRPQIWSWHRLVPTPPILPSLAKASETGPPRHSRRPAAGALSQQGASQPGPETAGPGPAPRRWSQRLGGVGIMGVGLAGAGVLTAAGFAISKQVQCKYT